MLFFLWLKAEYLENPQYTDHDESIFVPVMRAHKVGYLTSEVRDKDEEHKDSNHEFSSMFLCPLSKYGVFCMEIFGLEYCKGSNYEDKEEGKDT